MKFFSCIKRLNFKIVSLSKKAWWALEYGPYLELQKQVSFRKGMIINISDDAIVRVGRRTFFNNYCSINAHGEITIGNDCLFGEGVKIYDHNHIFYAEEKINEQPYSIGKVVIGNNCWICSNVIILKGAEIGNNCTISAGCIIKDKIPDNSLVRKDEGAQVIEVIHVRKNSDESRL
ncbi:acyltransferase [Lacrimispora indolis]|uniref:acyltransferase n=1 Tax=Lacrimispora indolis TaxID=69825 RepID=UPI000683DAD6|nr:acyltransferase [Lacrimispora indolis]